MLHAVLPDKPSNICVKEVASRSWSACISPLFSKCALADVISTIGFFVSAADFRDVALLLVWLTPTALNDAASSESPLVCGDIVLYAGSSGAQ